MKRVFLSFAAEDIGQVRGLRLLAANPAFEGVEFFDESVRREIDSTNQAYVRSVIREKINRTSVTVCLVGTTTYRSTWVDWELEESDKKGNTIIAMALKDVTSPTAPSLITRKGVYVWSWDPAYLGQLIARA
jgi:hypothetical protein